MAKKKDKSFSGKVIRGIRRELGRYDNVKFLAHFES